MRKILVAAAILGGIVAVYALTAGAVPNAGPAQDRVFGGGTFAPGCSDGPSPACFAAGREFSLLAVGNPNGLDAYGTFRYGRPDAGVTNTVGRVTCLSVRGNDAMIGGVIAESADPSFVGGPFMFFVHDTSTAGSFDRDRVSANFVDLPTAAPADCSQLDSNALGIGYFTLKTGDVVVEDS